MENTEDVRWKQRFISYKNALSKLKNAINYYDSQIDDFKDNMFSDIIKEGLIQRFEYTHELAWNLMKDYALYQGNSNVGGSRDAIKEAFKINLISDYDTWADMIASRNQTTHTYNEEVVNDIFTKIKNKYIITFLDFYDVMINKYNED